VRALLLALFAFTVACAGAAPPARTTYLMRAEISDGVTPGDAPVAIALGSVSVAPYLSDPGLVLETGAQQIHSARNHQWAEPLDAGLRIYLRTRISRELGYAVSANATTGKPPAFVVDVAVEELHGTLAGAARLVANWRIARPDGTGEFAAFRFARTLPLAQNGYAALAEAEIALVADLGTEIANSLRNATRTAPGAATGSSE
jgi:uncharacterized lipoprotein YmbA